MSPAIGLDAGIPAAIVLVTLTALAELIDLRVGRRTRVSLAGPFLVAAALVGGPLVGACAGAATEAFTTGDPWRKRALCAVAGALQGLVIGLVGEQFAQGGVSGAVVVAGAGLLSGFALNGRVVLRALGRGFTLRPELRAAWRPVARGRPQPAPRRAARERPRLSLGRGGVRRARPACRARGACRLRRASPSAARDAAVCDRRAAADDHGLGGSRSARRESPRSGRPRGCEP